MTTIGKSSRKFIDESKIELPGVGAYNIQPFDPNRTKGSSFTRALRRITQTADSGYSRRRTHSFSLRDPGPGSYSLELKDARKTVSFTHSKRFFTNPSPRPGPGQYKSQQCVKQKIKAGVIAKSTRVFMILGKDNPGPSEYLIPQVVKYKKKEPTIIIGHAKRELLEQKQLPGPGSYNIRSDKQHKLKNLFNFDRVWQGKKLEKQAKKVKPSNQITCGN